MALHKRASIHGQSQPLKHYGCGSALVVDGEVMSTSRYVLHVTSTASRSIAFRVKLRSGKLRVVPPVMPCAFISTSDSRGPTPKSERIRALEDP